MAQKTYVHTKSALNALWSDDTKTYWIDRGEQGDFEIPAEIIENSTDWKLKDEEIVVKAEVKPDELPEYVKHTGGFFITEDNVLGKVFKTSNPFPNLTHCRRLTWENTWAAHKNCFIVSTKEEYNIQNGIVEEPVKEYQILSFKGVIAGKSVDSTITLRKNGLYLNNPADPDADGLFSEEERLGRVKAGHNIIYSVKRLSDGEIFTVGDKISHLLDKDSISIIENIKIWRESIYFNDGECYIKNAIKIKEESAKQYEILEFEYTGKDTPNNKGLVINIRPNGNYYRKDREMPAQDAGGTLESNLKRVAEGDLKVRTVKRLLDGETFSIGDIVEDKFNNRWYIREIEINEVLIIRNYCIDNNHDNTRQYMITSSPEGLFKILKKVFPEFKTFDGLDAFKGDTLYIVSKNADNISWKYSGSITLKFWTPDERNLAFSTEEAAKEFIEKNNKVVLGKTVDGVDVYHGDTVYGVALRASGNQAIRKMVLDQYSTWSNKLIGARQWFSTEKDAKQYLLWNRECLSLEDIRLFYISVPRNKKLLELVEEKIK